jgi:hypothetical protein
MKKRIFTIAIAITGLFLPLVSMACQPGYCGYNQFYGNANQNTSTNVEVGHLHFNADNYYLHGSGAQEFSNEGSYGEYSGNNGYGKTSVAGGGSGFATRVGHNAYISEGFAFNTSTSLVSRTCNPRVSINGYGDLGTFAASQSLGATALGSTDGHFDYSGTGRDSISGSGITGGSSFAKTGPGYATAFSSQYTSSKISSNNNLRPGGKL